MSLPTGGDLTINILQISTPTPGTNTVNPPRAWVAKVPFRVAGIACPAKIEATASLRGKNIPSAINGSASVEVGAKTTTIEIR